MFQLNPQHTAPTLEVNGKGLWDSHAIATYLIGKYGKPNDSLYPQDLWVRARIDQRMAFETSALFSVLRSLSTIFFREGGWEVPEVAIKNANEAYEYLEQFLADSRYLVGDSLTVADFSVITTVTQLCKFIPIDAVKYPRTIQWIVRFDELPYFAEINTAWLDSFFTYAEGIRAKNKEKF